MRGGENKITCYRFFLYIKKQIVAINKQTTQIINYDYNIDLGLLVAIIAILVLFNENFY